MDDRQADAGRFTMDLAVRSLLLTRRKLKLEEEKPAEISQPPDVQDAARLLTSGAAIERGALMPGNGHGTVVNVAQNVGVNVTVDRERGLQMAEVYLQRHKVETPQ